MMHNGVRCFVETASSTMATGALTAESSNMTHMPMMSSSMSSPSSSLGYSIDSLFRVDPKTKPATAYSQRCNSEVTRIFVADLIRGDLPDQDKTYVAQVVAARTGSSQADAEQRVNTLFTNMMSTEADLKQKAKQACRCGTQGHSGRIFMDGYRLVGCRCIQCKFCSNLWRKNCATRLLDTNDVDKDIPYQ